MIYEKKFISAKRTAIAFSKSLSYEKVNEKIG